MTYRRTEDDARLLLGPIVDRGMGRRYFLALAAPFLALLADADALASATEDIGLASGKALDWLGAQVGERRAGLSDEEYRRVIAGRRVAIGGGVSAVTMRRALVALSGQDDAETRVTGAGRMLLVMRVSATPSQAYLRRCADIIASMVPAGRAWALTVGWPGVAEHNELPGFGGGIYGWSAGGGGE